MQLFEWKRAKIQEFLRSIKPGNHTSGGKGKKNREEQKGRRIEKKCNDCTPRSYFGDVFERKKKKTLPHGKGLIGGKVFKNSSRYVVCKNTFS